MLVWALIVRCLKSGVTSIAKMQYLDLAIRSHICVNLANRWRKKGCGFDAPNNRGVVYCQDGVTAKTKSSKRKKA